MNSNFTKLIFAGIATFMLAFPSINLFGQIPNDSPFPVDFIVEAPGGFSRTFDYVSVTNSTEWGVQPLKQTVSGELIWVDDDDIAGDGLDSLGCDTTSMADYTGKVALIRRGVCTFAFKAYYAQKAGAIGVVIVNNGGAALSGMSATDPQALEVTIPVVWIETADGAQFIPKVDAGESVIATFQVRSFYGELGPYAYGTPKDQIIPLDNIQVDLLNLNDTDPVFDVVGNVDITDPAGTVTTLTATLDSIAPASSATIEFADYLPSDVGSYEMVFTNSLTEDTIRRVFEITDYTYQIDNGNICTWPADCWIGYGYPYTDFVETDFLVHEWGNVYFAGPNGGTATHASFSIGNPDSLYTGDPSADVFTIILYDADTDGDGTIPGDEANYDNFAPVGFTTYVLTGEETPYEVLTVELEAPVTLNPNGVYLLMVGYNGVNSGLGIAPWPTFTGSNTYAAFEDVLFTDRLYMGGWSGVYNFVVRLHMDGFTPVSTKEVPPLDDAKVTLMPNPASDYLNVQLDLDEVADKVDIIITSVAGKMVMRQSFQNVQKETITFDTNNLPNGQYYLAINTPEGFRAKKFVVIK